MTRLGWVTSVVLTLANFAGAATVSAQLTPRTGRFSLDAELLSAGRVHFDPDGPGNETDTAVIGIGANQLGSSRAYLPSTPLGLGVGYVLDEKWILGLRIGFGYDWLSPEQGPNERVLALSAVPKVTWVPGGDERAKFFVDLGPLIQYNRIKRGGDEQNLLAGGFEVGVGTLRFFGQHASLDLGAYFQGRFGKYEVGGSLPDEDDVTIRDLRGVLRLGGSLWARRYEHRETSSDELHRSIETRPPPPAPVTPAPEPAYVPPPTTGSPLPAEAPPPPP